jgi:hypothetical protein
MTRTTGALHEDPHTFFYHISMNALRMRNVLDKSCRENQNTFRVHYLFFENRAVYEKTYKNIVGPSGPQVKIRRMRTECWICKATNTLSQYAILIAFPVTMVTRPHPQRGVNVLCLYCFVVTPQK